MNLGTDFLYRGTRMPSTHNTVQMKELFKFIKILHDEQKKAWSAENPNNEKFVHCVEALEHSHWFKLEDADVNKLEEIWIARQLIDFDTVRKFGKKVLFLPPLEKEDGFFAVMWLRCNLEPYSSNIRIMLFKKKSEEELAERPKNHFWAVGFRFETGKGMHNYHHAQLINNFKGKDNSLIFFDSIPWLPLTQPAFPLYAIDPLTMMISLYLTLYGLDRFRKFTLDYGRQLKQILDVASVKTFKKIIDTTVETAVAVKPRKR